MAITITPMKVQVPQAVLDDLRSGSHARAGRVRYPAPDGSAGPIWRT